MRDRWREPARILYWEQDETLVLDEPDGRSFGGLQMTFDADTIERLRLGRVCAKCLEPQEVAFPARCRVCGFAIGDEQREWFERFFKGLQLPARRSTKDDLDRMLEDHERRERV